MLEAVQLEIDVQRWPVQVRLMQELHVEQVGHASDLEPRVFLETKPGEESHAKPPRREVSESEPTNSNSILAPSRLCVTLPSS